MMIYWFVLSLIGFIHIEQILMNLSWQLPYYLTYPVILIISYLLFKKMMIHTIDITQKWHILLSLTQLLLLLTYIPMKPSWLMVAIFLIFIGIEIARWDVAMKMNLLINDQKQYEEERSHLTETLRIVRSERHDFLKHVASIHYMLENHHHEEAAAYLDDLVDGYEETNLSIKGERGSVAGILQEMYNRGKASGVTMIYDADMPFSTLPMKDKHIVTLLGNLLSNSIEASTEWKIHSSKQANVSLQFYKRSGLYMIICQNPSLPIPTPILDRLYQSFGHTTKNKHEGLGTKIIHDTVHDYMGSLDFTYKEEEFTVKIKIPAIHQGKIEESSE
ncbi:GHKL domain-containing protein [Bacillus sp. MCCB 382]|uniref:sensor histidine kinase n=1 Tax=Bacillus sp. MCCB 382 TaxID=2860197 RepID=UPI00214CB522